MDPTRKQDQQERSESPSEPSAREHGVDGYTSGAVGGFGAGYAGQVAHGGVADSPGELSESEGGESFETGLEQEELERAVRKTLARAHVDAADLRVEVHGSEVRLLGTVRQLFEKTELELRARAVPGVSSVVSELFVLR
jgi:osmotically-inducible protein OsmY